MHIVVASTSQIKLNAVRHACSSLFVNKDRTIEDIKIECIRTESSVSNQPFNEETLTGALNRYNSVRDIYKGKIPYEYLISIENGIFGDQINGYYDMAYVIINGTIFKSEAYPIPTDVVNKVLESEKKCTAGQIIDPINHDNWFPRVQILSDCIINGFKTTVFRHFII